EHRHAFPTALAVRAVVQRAAPAGCQQTARVVGDRVVGARAAQVAGGPVRPDHPAGTDPRRVGVLDDRGHRDRVVRPYRLDDVAQLREILPGHPVDVDVDDAATGQSDRERVVVGDAVALQHRTSVGDDLLRQVVDGTFHTPTGHE